MNASVEFVLTSTRTDIRIPKLPRDSTLFVLSAYYMRLHLQHGFDTHISIHIIQIHILFLFFSFFKFK